MIEEATYAEILLSEYPNAVWSGSGVTYDSIKWSTPPIPKGQLDALVVTVARKREIRRATKKIREGAERYMQDVGFVSAATGRLLHYTGDNEAFDYLTAQAVASFTHDTEIYLCVTDDGLTPHTAEQVRYAHADAVQARADIYLSMMQQINGLQSMPYSYILGARFAV
jgi:hypothetical protein